MDSPPKKGLRRVGRPPSGLREGETVRDYPQFSTRLPPDALATLQLLSEIGARPMWRVIVDAVDCYLRERPLAEQRMVEKTLRASVRKRSRT